MIQTHVDPGNHIIEITISGHIERKEFNETLQKIDAPMNEWEDIRILKRVDSFEGMDFMALIDDFKFAYEHFKNYSKIKKTALVTDKKWLTQLAEFAKPIVPGETKIFENEDVEEARSWLK
jgi:hypothetical protein